jgi:hypothetical protein
MTKHDNGDLPADASPYDLVEGKRDPASGKMVQVMILQDGEFAVYLDEDLFSYWRWTDDYEEPDRVALSNVLNRTALLAAR